MIGEFLFSPVELALNRGLQQSSTAAAMAGGLEGRTLDLRIEATPLHMRIGILGGRFRVTAPSGELPDAGISGTPLGLGRLLGNDPEAAVREGMVQISGDAEIAGAFRELLHYARPDLEAELSRLVGAPLAREAAEAARAFSAWGQRAAEGMARDAGELLGGSGRVLVGRAEFEQFSRRVDELVNDVARAEARLQQVRRRD